MVFLESKILATELVGEVKDLVQNNPGCFKCIYYNRFEPCADAGCNYIVSINTDSYFHPIWGKQVVTNTICLDPTNENKNGKCKYYKEKIKLLERIKQWFKRLFS